MNVLKEIKGSILIIGSIDEKSLGDITDIYYLNNKYNDSNDIEDNSLNITKNMHLKNLHKYFKNGVDNIYATYKEVKDYYPSFIRESLKITHNIYINFKYKKDYEFLLKKYKRYNISITKYEDNDLYMIINIKKVNKLILFYYYILDNIEHLYNRISDNI